MHNPAPKDDIPPLKPYPFCGREASAAPHRAIPAAPAKPVEPVAVETPADASSEVVDALRKRLEDIEASMTAALEALERAQERASVVAGAETPARVRTGLLARLWGRQRGVQP